MYYKQVCSVCIVYIDETYMKTTFVPSSGYMCAHIHPPIARMGRICGQSC